MENDKHVKVILTVEPDKTMIANTAKVVNESKSNADVLNLCSDYVQELIDTAKQIDVRSIIERKSLLVKVNMCFDLSKRELAKDVVGETKLVELC